MNSLRLEQEEAQAKVEEFQSKVKTLEQENLAKEQEITSLSHKNGLLEAEVEKLEGGIKKAKDEAEEIGHAGTQNEALQRKLQLLEEEAEESDKNMRETNEKYDTFVSGTFKSSICPNPHELTTPSLDYAKQMSKLVITSARFKPLRVLETSGRRSTKRWPRNTQQ